MEKANIPHSRLSTYSLRKIISDDEYTLVNLTDELIEFNLGGYDRMRQILDMSGSPFAYSDYIDNGALHRLIPFQAGALRDDFDFGKVVMIRTRCMREILDNTDKEYEAAGWYSLRLGLTRMGMPVYCPEPLYSISRKATTDIDGEAAHFAYVDPKNRESQIEMEQAVTDHLIKIGGYIPPFRRNKINVSEGTFPVEASVIIPVRNRERTISDAVHSALGQQTDFDFNIIVVNNRSSDATSEILTEIAAGSPRLHIIDTSSLPYPASEGAGIWHFSRDIADVSPCSLTVTTCTSRPKHYKRLSTNSVPSSAPWSSGHIPSQISTATYSLRGSLTMPNGPTKTGPTTPCASTDSGLPVHFTHR